MTINLISTHGKLNFKGTNARGQSVQLSGSKEAVSPKENLLMSVAGCSAIDVEIFLEKMRQPVEKIEVVVDGTTTDTVPSVFSDIHLHYKIYGDVKESKAEKAVQMSMDTYCSVSIMLQKASEIKHSFEVIKKP